MSVTRDQLREIIAGFDLDDPFRKIILNKWFEMRSAHSISVDERADIVAYYFDLGEYSGNSISEYEDILEAQELMELINS